MTIRLVRLADGPAVLALLRTEYPHMDAQTARNVFQRDEAIGVLDEEPAGTINCVVVVGLVQYPVAEETRAWGTEVKFMLRPVVRAGFGTRAEQLALIRAVLKNALVRARNRGADRLHLQLPHGDIADALEARGWQAASRDYVLDLTPAEAQL